MRTPLNGTYSHTQRATLIVAVMLAMAAVSVAIGFLVTWPALVVAPLLAITAWLFSSLTIEVDDNELRWRFGPGLISKRVPRSDIVEAKVVRTNFIEGWGIHLSRFGWLYNVSGWDAVAVTTRHGKRFALGTDEPDALRAAVVTKQE